MCACGYVCMCSVTPSRAQSWIRFVLHVRLIRDESATWIRIKKESPKLQSLKTTHSFPSVPSRAVLFVRAENNDQMRVQTQSMPRANLLHKNPQLQSLRQQNWRVDAKWWLTYRMLVNVRPENSFFSVCVFQQVYRVSDLFKQCKESRCYKSEEHKILYGCHTKASLHAKLVP